MVKKSDNTLLMKPIQQVGQLKSGKGSIGRGRELQTIDEARQFTTNLALYTRRLIDQNTADCGDERKTLRLGDISKKSDYINGRIVPQMFGGIGLATAKAAVAAQCSSIKNANSFTKAYQIVVDQLLQLGYSDGAHAACGASANVASSVEIAIDTPLLLSEIALFTKLSSSDKIFVEEIASSQRSLLNQGYYSDWDPSWHETFVRARYPGNFSYLEVDKADKVNHGHNAAGLYVINKSEYGFAKNLMIQNTDKMALCVTTSIMREIANKLGKNADESRRIEIAFYIDTIRVGSVLVAPTLQIFA